MQDRQFLSLGYAERVVLCRISFFFFFFLYGLGEYFKSYMGSTLPSWFTIKALLVGEGEGNLLTYGVSATKLLVKKSLGQSASTVTPGSILYEK